MELSVETRTGSQFVARLTAVEYRFHRPTGEPVVALPCLSKIREYLQGPDETGGPSIWSAHVGGGPALHELVRERGKTNLSLTRDPAFGSSAVFEKGAGDSGNANRSIGNR